MTFPQSLTAALEAACNHYLALDDETLPRLAAFEGKVIAIEVLSLNQTSGVLHLLQRVHPEALHIYGVREVRLLHPLTILL